jgi:voltage-gated potassium channel
MNEIAQQPGDTAGGDYGAGDPGGRLAAYQDRTQTPLDLLALVTLWFVVVPPWYYNQDVQGAVWVFRIALSAVYGTDLAIRGVLAGRPLRYALSKPVALASVLFPPVRVLFSFRLAREMFRRGHLGLFLLAAGLLVVNGAVITYLFERHAPGANIHTLGQAFWWALVTVTTVGYGDYTPVTIPGRVTAGFIMGTGLLTLAVLTAQVASSFVAQAPSRPSRLSRPRDRPRTESAPREVTLAELDQRLARIEELLARGLHG